MLKEINATRLTLVPKVPNVDRTCNFRPIPCCNTIYKCIAKLVANRISSCLPSLISSNQTAFVQGRKIEDSIPWAQQLVGNYQRTNLSARCALKVDLKNAFDSVSRKFLCSFWLRIFQFNLLIGFMLVYLLPLFSININGGLCGWFVGQNGIRQGDPLSPYLFVIAMEALSCTLDKAALQGQLPFHPKRKKIALTRQCFADDLLIVTNRSVQGI